MRRSLPAVVHAFRHGRIVRTLAGASFTTWGARSSSRPRPWSPGPLRALSQEAAGTASPTSKDGESAAPAAAEPPHYKLSMPDMGQSNKVGTVLSWRKKEGEFVKNGDIICEVEMDQFLVGMEIADKGFLARILVPAGTKDVKVGEALAILVYDDANIDAFRAVPQYQPPAPPAAEAPAPVEQHPSGVDMLKFLHKLAKTGSIKDKEFEKKLMSLARRENPELLRVFEASFEGDGRTEENFDLDFFLENAHAIVEEASVKS